MSQYCGARTCPSPRTENTELAPSSAWIKFDPVAILLSLDSRVSTLSDVAPSKFIRATFSHVCSTSRRASGVVSQIPTLPVVR